MKRLKKGAMFSRFSTGTRTAADGTLFNLQELDDVIDYLQQKSRLLAQPLAD